MLKADSDPVWPVHKAIAVNKTSHKQALNPQPILHVLKQAHEDNGISVANEAKRMMAPVSGLAIATLRAKYAPDHPVRDALSKNKTQHKRLLITEEMGQLLRAVDSHGGYHQIQCIFNLMWLTLARPTKAIEAEWSEIDLETALWRIPAERMKKRKEHLPPSASSSYPTKGDAPPVGSQKTRFSPSGTTRSGRCSRLHSGKC